MVEPTDNPHKYRREGSITKAGITIHDDTLADLERIADNLDIPRSWVVEAAVLDFLAHYDGYREPESRVSDVIEQVDW